MTGKMGLLNFPISNTPLKTTNKTTIITKIPNKTWHYAVFEKVIIFLNGNHSTDVVNSYLLIAL